MKITVLQHVPYEGPAAVADWASENGIETETVHLHAGALPPDPGAIEGLLILGGPMSVGDTERFPWLSTEIDLIRAALEREIPILGVCLGAQLIAAAAGARVLPMGYREIGWWEIEGPDDRFTAFHWHGDQFEIPAGAVHLYGSAACSQQGFSLGEKVTALQFHLEMTAEAVTGMLVNGRDEIQKYRASPWVQTADEIAALTPTGLAETAPRLDRLLRKLFYG